MQIEYLYYLIKINQCRSISAAARELYISQNALSSALRRVEEELGFPIFLRGRSQLELTAEGEEAIALIREVTAAYDEIKHMGRRIQEGNQAVKLLCSPSINCALSAPLSAAMERFPTPGDLFIAETTGMDVSAKILKNKFNIALTYFQPAAYDAYQNIAGKYQIQVSKLFSDHLYLLMRRDNPLSGSREIDRSTLTGQEFALLSHFTLTSDEIATTKPIEGRNRITVFSNVPLIKRAVLEQNMLSILSGYAIAYDTSVDGSLLSAVPLAGLDDANKLELCLIHREKQSLSPVEQYIVDFIKDYFSGLDIPLFAPERR